LNERARPILARRQPIGTPVNLPQPPVHQHMQAPNLAAGSGVLFSFGGGGNRAAGLYAPSDEGMWSGLLRAQRNFWP
jgi:hypothetical protein